MDEAHAHAGIELPDGRTLYVGPITDVSAITTDGDSLGGQIQMLAMVVEHYPGDPVTDATWVGPDGEPLYDPVSVADAIAMAPEKGLDIVAAAMTLIDAALAKAREAVGSDDPTDKLLVSYVADYAKPFAAEVGAAARAAQRELRADLDGGVGL